MLRCGRKNWRISMGCVYIHIQYIYIYWSHPISAAVSRGFHLLFHFHGNGRVAPGLLDHLQHLADVFLPRTLSSLACRKSKLTFVLILATKWPTHPSSQRSGPYVSCFLVTETSLLSEFPGLHVMKTQAWNQVSKNLLGNLMLNTVI